MSTQRKYKQQKKRRNSKLPPNTNINKKQKQSDIDSQSESEPFLDAEDQIRSELNLNSKNTENMDQFIDNVADETLSPSQSMLPPPPPPDMSTPVSQAPPLQFINSVPSLLATSAPLYQHQQQVPQMHLTSVGLSDNDVMRVALQVKLMISDEINRLVREKVESATYDFRNAIEALRIENKELRGNLSDMEIKLENDR